MVDLWVSLAGLGVGFVVGLTGMGGGALMTPILVLLFGVQPLTAVSSDLVASLAMKPLGSALHIQRGTVHRGLVRWLVLGSVPSAFVGVLLLKLFGTGPALENAVKLALGIALLVVSTALIVKQLVGRRASDSDISTVVVRPIPTLLVGIIGGLVVGMTSVGSGSLIILMLIALYPKLRLNQLVGTDLVQAVPLVAAASAAHLLFGDFKLALTASVLIGALPGVYFGARLSSRAPDHLIRPTLIVVLLASGLKLVGASNLVLACALAVSLPVAAWAALSGARQRRGSAPELDSALVPERASPP